MQNYKKRQNEEIKASGIAPPERIFVLRTKSRGIRWLHQKALFLLCKNRLPDVIVKNIYGEQYKRYLHGGKSTMLYLNLSGHDMF